MAKKLRNTVIFAKRETTYATDSVPAAADAMLVRNSDLTPYETDYVARGLVRPYFGNDQQLPTGTRVVVEFEVEMASSGAAGTAPAYAVLLKACNLAETITASVSAAYKPSTTDVDSATIYYNMDGVLHKIIGARGSVTFNVTANQIPYLKFRFVGIYAAPTDSVAASPDYSDFMVPVAATKTNTPTFTLHGFAAVLSAFELDLSNQVEYRGLIGTGAESVQVTDRMPKGKAVIEATSVAAKNWWTTVSAATLGAVQVIHGVGAGNICQFDASNVQLTNPRYTDDQGIAMLNLDLVFVPGASGNDEFTYTVK